MSRGGGTFSLWRQAGLVQPGEEKAPERSYSTFQHLKELQERWEREFYKGIG